MNEIEKWCQLDFGKIRKVFIMEVAVLVSALSVMGYAGVKSGDWNKNKHAVVSGWQQVEKFITQMQAEDEKKSNNTNNNWPSKDANVNVIINNSTTTTVNTGNKVSNDKSTTVNTSPAVIKTCFRYTVTHLDGSTSNRCYSRTDYDILTDLGYKLSSAKTFYEFQSDGAADYQAEYDRTKSKIYLDAKASSEASAAREKEKIGSITLQMQEVEKRGY